MPAAEGVRLQERETLNGDSCLSSISSVVPHVAAASWKRTQVTAVFTPPASTHQQDHGLMLIHPRGIFRSRFMGGLIGHQGNFGTSSDTHAAALNRA